MKKLLLTLGTLATIAAPVAAVVSCGSSNENNGGNSGFTDGTKNKTTEEKAIDKMISGAVGSYEAWALDSSDIALAITNTRTEGILKNIDFSSSINSVITKDQKPVKTIEITKQEIIDAEKTNSLTKFESVAKELKTLDVDKKYSMSIKTITPDKLPDNGGSFEINIYEKANNLQLMNTAITAFNDKTKFAFDKDMMKSLHGTYIYGQSHEFKINASGGFLSLFGGGAGSIFEDKITIKNPESFKDRINQGNFKSWTMLSPVKSTVFDTKKSFKDGDKTIELNNAYFVKDLKTRKMNLVLKIVEKEKDRVIDTQTTYIQDDYLTSFSTVKFDKDKFEDIFKNYYSFKPVYKFFTKLKTSAGSLGADMAALKEVIMRTSSRINLLAKANDFLTTTPFLDGFISYITKDATFANNLMQGMIDYKETVDNDRAFQNYGAHSWNGIQWSDEILEKLSTYIGEKEKDGTFTLSSVRDADALNKILAGEADKS